MATTPHVRLLPDWISLSFAADHMPDVEFTFPVGYWQHAVAPVPTSHSKGLGLHVVRVGPAL